MDGNPLAVPNVSDCPVAKSKLTIPLPEVAIHTVLPDTSMPRIILSDTSTRVSLVCLFMERRRLVLISGNMESLRFAIEVTGMDG